MKRWAPFLILLGLAFAVGLSAGQEEQGWALPSVENPGPRGLKVLSVWLTEAGHDVRRGTQPLTELPRDIATVLIPAPQARKVSAEEVEALEAFVQDGGTLIYLAPRGAEQPYLERKWLHAKAGALAPLSTEGASDDLGGSTLDVTLPGSALRGVSKLRISSETMLSLEGTDAIAVTKPAGLWWRPLGKGEIWAAAGSELAENSRLELFDNARFWQNIAARGPLYVDEFHHTRALALPISPNLLATAAQLLLCGLLFVLAFGARLGPPRPTLPVLHRDALEYVRAMANLTQAAKVDGQLVTALRAETRELLRDKLGLPLSLEWLECVRVLRQRTTIPEAALVGLMTETNFLALSRTLALLDAQLSGRT